MWVKLLDGHPVLQYILQLPADEKIMLHREGGWTRYS